MFEGFVYIFIGISSIVLSLFFVNSQDRDASFVKRKRRQLFIFGGIMFIGAGTIEFILTLLQ